jgi:hypothetical protein
MTYLCFTEAPSNATQLQLYHMLPYQRVGEPFPPRHLGTPPTEQQAGTTQAPEFFPVATPRSKNVSVVTMLLP